MLQITLFIIQHNSVNFVAQLILTTRHFQTQNGDGSSSKKMHPGEFTGSNNRPEGRLLSNPPSTVLPQIFRLHDRQQNLSLPIHAIRPLPGPMGVYTRHGSSYERDPQQRHIELLPVRRFPNNSPTGRRINPEIKEILELFQKPGNTGKWEQNFSLPTNTIQLLLAPWAVTRVMRQSQEGSLRRTRGAKNRETKS